MDPKETEKVLASADQCVQDSKRLLRYLKDQKDMPQKDRDEITLAKSIFDEIVEFTEHEETPKETRARKGGQARKEKLTPEERSEIAKKAARARWKK